MAVRIEPETFGQKVTAVAFFATLAFCGDGLFPQRGRVAPDWPPHVFYAIMAVVGLVCGPIITPAYRLPGLIGGMITGVGSLFATSLYVENFGLPSRWVWVMVAALGCFPGFGIFQALAAWQDARRRLPPSFPMPDDEDVIHKRWTPDSAAASSVPWESTTADGTTPETSPDGVVRGERKGEPDSRG